MTLNLLLALLFDATLLIICIYAIALGGRTERIGAAINLIAAGMTIGLRVLGIATGAPAEVVILSVDVGVAASFYWLATHTIRFWPIWAFGFALADIITSVAGALMPKTPLFAYHTGLGLYAYLALAALALGTTRLSRRATPEVKRGDRPPWSHPPDKTR